MAKPTAHLACALTSCHLRAEPSVRALLARGGDAVPVLVLPTSRIPTFMGSQAACTSGAQYTSAACKPLKTQPAPAAHASTLGDITNKGGFVGKENGAGQSGRVPAAKQYNRGWR